MLYKELYKISIEGIPTLYGYRYSQHFNTRAFERYAHEESAAFAMSLLTSALSKGKILSMTMEHCGEDTAVKSETVQVKVIEIIETLTARANEPRFSTQQFTFMVVEPTEVQETVEVQHSVKPFTKLMAVTA